MTSPMGGNVVGSAEIVLSPELDKTGLAAFKRQIRAATSAAAKAASRSLKQELGPLNSNLTKGADQNQMKARAQAMQSLRRTTKIYQSEADAWKSLQKQKTSALTESTRIQKQKLAEVSRAFDTQLLQVRTALKNGQMSNAQYSRSVDGIMTSARGAGLSIDDLARKSSSLATITSTSFLDGIYKAGSAMSQMATRVGMLGYQMQLLGRTMSTFISLPIGAALGGAAYVGLKQAAAIEAAMRGMVALKPNENILPFFKSMMDLAEASPVFETGPLLEGIRNLAAAGMETQKIDELVRSMGNIGLTMGVSGQQMNRAFFAFSQIAGKGKLYAEELNQQLGDAIPGVKALLAEGLGISQKALNIRLTPGGKGGPIMADEFFDAMRKIGQSERFTKGAATGVLTLQSAYQSFIETTKNALAKQFLTEGLLVKPEIVEGLNKLGNAVSTLIQSAGNAGVFTGMITLFTKFVEVVDSLVKKYDSLSESQQSAIFKFAGVAAAIGPVMMAIAPLFSTLGMFANSMATVGIAIGGIATPAGAAALAILGTTAALVTLGTILYTKVEPFRKKLNQGLVETARLFDEHVMPAVNDLWAELTLLGREFNNLGIDWGTVATAITGYLKGIVFGITILIRSFQLGVRWGKIFGQIAANTFGAFLIPIGIATELLLKFTRVLEKIPHFGGGFSEFRGDLEGFQGGLSGMADRLRDFGSESGTADRSAFSLSTTLGGLGNMFSSNAVKALTMADAVDTLRGKLLSAKDAASENVDASDGWKRSQLALKESIAANSLTLSDQTRKGMANRDAFKAATQASVEKTLADIKSGVPMQQAIALHDKRIKSLQGEFGKTKANRAAVTELSTAYDKIPRDVRTLLKMLGFTDVDKKLTEMYAQQRALKRGTTFQEELNLAKKQERLAMKGYASGGWTGSGGKYQPAGIVHADEHVIQKSSRKKIESTNPGLLDYINRRGSLPAQYADGGRVQTWPFRIDVSKTKIPEAVGVGPGGIVGAGGSGGQSNWAWMRSWLLARFPSATANPDTGRRDGGYHGMGRALDIFFSDGSERTGGGTALKAFNAIKSTFMGSIKELIWDFAGNKAVWNGQNHFFTGPGAGPGTHNDHIHWAHDNGGPLYDGMLTRNSSGQTETVLNAAQGKAFEERLKGSGDGPEIRVFIGNEEFKGYIRTEVRNENRQTVGALKRGRRG